jgi:hypothetical protein
MKRRIFTTFIALLTFTFVVAITELRVLPHLQHNHESQQTINEVISVENKTISFKGISFTYSSRLTSEVKAETRPASLEGKPGGLNVHKIFEPTFSTKTFRTAKVYFSSRNVT